VETFVQMSRIRESLQNGEVKEALAWCAENKKDLRRMEVWFLIEDFGQGADK
jgi:macrophage erythroblast attacher